MSDQLTLGELLRDAGMATALSNADEEWKRRCQAYIEFKARTGEVFTSETVCAAIDRPPGSGNVVGAMLRAAARRGLIEPIGHENAQRPGMHATELRQWRGKR